MSAPESHPPASFAQILVTPLGDIAELTYDSLDDNQRICQTIDSVRRDDAGAIAVFLGTTRDNFQGEVEALCARHMSVNNEFTQPIILMFAFPSRRWVVPRMLDAGIRPQIRQGCDSPGVSSIHSTCHKNDV